MPAAAANARRTHISFHFQLTRDLRSCVVKPHVSGRQSCRPFFYFYFLFSLQANRFNIPLFFFSPSTVPLILVKEPFLSLFEQQKYPDMPTFNPPPAYSPRTTPARSNSSAVPSGRNRSLALLGSKNRSVSAGPIASSGKRSFFQSFKGGSNAPQLGKRLFRVIKNENQVINSYEGAGRERIHIATQLSEWGEQCGKYSAWTELPSIVVYD